MSGWQVFWLSDHPTPRAFPRYRAVASVSNGRLRLSSPVTAAGPRRIFTGFPFKPLKGTNGFELAAPVASVKL